MQTIDPRYLYMLLPFTVGIILFIIVWGGVRLDRKNAALRQKAQAQAERQSEINGYEEEIRALVTDIKAALNDQEALLRLQEQCSACIGEIHGSDPVVDALLADKAARCRQAGIRLQLELTGTPLPLSEEETVSLLGNLLDNAIEAAWQCEEKWIRVEDGLQSGQWFLRVSNAKRSELVLDGDRMATTKPDADRHGIGLKIIRRIVARKKGYLKMEDRGDSFMLFVAIPAERG